MAGHDPCTISSEKAVSIEKGKIESRKDRKKRNRRGEREEERAVLAALVRLRVNG